MGRTSDVKFDSNFIELWRAGSGTSIVQPNLITTSSFRYSLVQMRVFICLMSMLQSSLREYFEKRKLNDSMDVSQLSLFAHPESNRDIRMELPFKAFNLSSNRYDELRKAAELMCSIPIYLPDTVDANGNVTKTVASLISEVNFKAKGGRTFDVVLRPNVAEFLHRIMPEDGGFTRYIKEVALSLQSPYAIKIYMFLSSWLKNGGTKITMVKFRHLLSIEDSYKTYSDLKKRILEPCKAIFKENCEFWFEYSESYKDEKTTGEPHVLVFKIIKYRNPAEKAADFQQRLPMILNLMNYLLQIEMHNVEKLKIYINADNYETLDYKLLNLCELKEDYSKMKKIDNKRAYFFNAIKNVVAPDVLSLKWTRN